MENVVNKDKDVWVRPWNIEKFDTLNIKDERFFSILIKGVLSFFNSNILLYNKEVKHFIYNTGSGYLYIEKNGYEYVLTETSNEDYIYMELPRCIVEIGDITFTESELTNPFVSGVYERNSSIDNTIRAYTAEVRRLPIEISLNLKYILGNFNESIILVEELINNLIYQKYFSITYLGNEIKCSIEYPSSNKIQFNKIDMTSKDQSIKTIEFDCKLNSSYPIINTKTEIEANKIIKSFNTNTSLGYTDDNNNQTISDIINKNNIQK